jgi:hypothetical protein
MLICPSSMTDDGAKFQRARAKSDKRAAKLAAQEAAEIQAGDDTQLGGGAAAVTAAQRRYASMAQSMLPEVCVCVGEGGQGISGVQQPTRIHVDAHTIQPNGTHANLKPANPAAAHEESDDDGPAEEGEEDGGDDEDEDEEGDVGDDEMVAMFARPAIADIRLATASLASPFVHLVFISGPYRMREVRVDAPGATIGSSQSVDVSLLKDGSVSEIHAALSFVNNEWMLADAGSATGTFLLVEDVGQPVDVGDVYRIARTEVQMLAVLDAYATG